jgi:hypothetical protein
VRPYLGGAELNASADQHPTRWAIFFGELSEQNARGWPELMSILEEKVRPRRAEMSSDLAEWPWWQYWRTRRELYEAVSTMDRFLICAQTSRTLAFSFSQPSTIVSHKVIAIVMNGYGEFTVLQSRLHQEWAYFFGSTLKDDPVYTPSDCFETFPFPNHFETDSVLKSAGQPYYDFRAALMIRNNEGLTKTYNRFHDPDERSPDILKLRELHAAMDRAVLDAYGWTDLKPTCEFLLDYEEDDDEDESAPARRRKKPWRYRWPDDLRDEVLARLLELNRQRAEEERLSGAAAEGKTKKPRKSGKMKSLEEEPGLF